MNTILTAFFNTLRDILGNQRFRLLMIFGVIGGAVLLVVLFILFLVFTVGANALAHDESAVEKPSFSLVRCTCAAVGGLIGFLMASNRISTSDRSIAIVTAFSAIFAYLVAYTLLTGIFIAAILFVLWQHRHAIRSALVAFFPPPEMQSPDSNPTAANQQRLIQLRQRRDWVLNSGAPEPYLSEELARIDAEISRLQ